MLMVIKLCHFKNIVIVILILDLILNEIREEMDM